MVCIVRYYVFVNNPEALKNLQAHIELGKFLDRSSDVQAQGAAYNRESEGKSWVVSYVKPFECSNM